MKFILAFFTLVLFTFFSNLNSRKTKKSHFVDNTNIHKLDSCFFEGKRLYGKVKFVAHESQADVKVQFVTSFPDLKVQFVECFPDACGEWQVVEHYPDLNVYVTESFPDIKIQTINSFPGIR